MSARRVLAIVAAFWVVRGRLRRRRRRGRPRQGRRASSGSSDPLRSLLLGDSGQDLSSQVLDVLRERLLREGRHRPRSSRRPWRRSSRSSATPTPTTSTRTSCEALRDRNDGAYFGVGLQVAQRDDAIVVTRVFDGSPAAEAGVKALDRVVSVNGTPAAGRGLEAVVGDIRGKEGTTVTPRRPDRRRPAAKREADARPHPGAGGRLAHRHGRRAQGRLHAARPVHPRRLRRAPRGRHRPAREGGARRSCSTCAATRAAWSARPSASRASS